MLCKCITSPAHIYVGTTECFCAEIQRETHVNQTGGREKHGCHNGLLRCWRVEDRCSVSASEDGNTPTANV